MIQIRNLDFTHPQGGFRLHIDDLAIAPGQRVAWTGPSGTGKTTLLHLVAGILQPAAGHLESCGTDLTRLGDAARRDFRITNLGLVFQDFALLDYLTVLDNILLPYRVNRALRLDSSVRERADRLATDVGIEPFLHARPARFSRGEQQRVAVCRALIANPSMLLADEPTANLDPDNASRVLDALDDHAHRQNATLIVVTHDPNISSRLDRTIDIAPFGASSQPIAPSGASSQQTIAPDPPRQP